MLKDTDIFSREITYFEKNSAQMICTDLYQKLSFPKEFPAFIQVHRKNTVKFVPVHWHAGTELIYVRSQMHRVIIEGQNYMVHPGEFILVNSNDLHSVVPSYLDEPQDGLGITFNMSYLEKMWPNLRECRIDGHGPHATEDSRKKMIEYCELIREQTAELKEKRENYFSINQTLFAILHLMYTDFLVDTGNIATKYTASRNKMMEILSYIQENYKENLTTQTVASHWGYSREYFCRIFKRYTSQTFKEYLMELRLEESVKQLQHSKQTIAQIAFDNGFPDEKSFYQIFKQRYNITPSKFRKNS
ncbi:MAG: AraC family transcriptional regulator [Lachnospiraceae bacterium]|nr:AraC family transcriptional regulator [Lachnospiraceae bacterium]MDD3617713.1 AraC family transcriptional regulator [Lachnospiraceae bacterium]